MFVLLGCASSDRPEGNPLAPALGVTQTRGYTFQFTAIGPEADSYTWNFGDGQSASGRTAEHTFGAEGRYEVTLEVMGAQGAFTLSRYVHAQPLSLHLSAANVAQGRGAFTLENAADAPLTWRLEAEHDPANPAPGPWFSAAPASGTLRGGASAKVAVRPEPGLAPGFYFSTLTLGRGKGALTFDVAAQVGAAQPRVTLSAPRAVVIRGRSEAALSVRVSGFKESAYLSLRDAPAGVRLRLPDPKVSDTETAPLSVAPLPDAPLGEYEVVLEASSGDEIAAATLLVEVLERGAGRARVSGEVVTENAAITIPSAPAEADLDDEVGADTARNAAQSARATRPRYVPAQLLIRYASPSVAEWAVGSPEETLSGGHRGLAAALRRDYGLRILTAGGSGQPDLVALAPGRDVHRMAAEIARDPRVAHVEPNYYLDSATLPNDPSLPEQWGLAAAGVPAAWSAASDAEEVVVAVVDTGFDLEHPDLAGRFLPGYNFCAGEGICGDQMDDDPSYGDLYNGHGTHVAGLIGAVGDNDVGIAGVAARGVKLLPIKVFDSFGAGATSASVIQGIRWAAGLEVEGAPTNPHPARIINMSLGGTFKSAFIQDAIDDAREAGALLIAATGNDGVDTLRTPAAAEGVLGVGAVTTDFERACYSNYGTNGEFGPGAVDLMAPGGDTCGGGPGVLSTLPGDYGEQAGTSMAAPIVSGLAALALAREPKLSVDDLEAKLLNATYFDPKTMDAYDYGAGVVRAEKLFGLPSPGDEVSVSASGEGSSAVDYVKLDLYGGSEFFELKGLNETRHTLEVNAGTTSRAFQSSKTVKLAAGELETDITLSLEP